jgi:hypothetical protein
VTMCAACGRSHPSSLDRDACAAIGGRVRGPSLGWDTEVLETLCGLCGPLSEVLEHLRHHHGHAEVPEDGRLLRPVYETRATGGAL